MARRPKARLDRVVGARPAEMPSFIEPMKPTLVAEPMEGPKWIHEVKFDGYRVQVHRSGGRTKIYSSNGNDFTEQFASIALDIDQINAEQFVIDGEAVVQDETGRPNFSRMQSRARGRAGGEHLVFYAFDLLHLDGFDLRNVVLVERKQLLQGLFAKAGATRAMFYSEHFAIEGAAMFAQAERMGLEGIVSKSADSVYRSGRAKTWFKAKCTQRAVLPIVGFIPAPAGHIAALYLGEREGKKLNYAGKVGTGFSGDMSQKIRARLEGLLSRRTHLTDNTKKPKARWVEPILSAEVEFLERGTGLRHASFKGLRE